MSSNDISSSTISRPTSPPIPAFEQRFHAARQEFTDYLPLTQQVQHDLRADAEELRSQEGWDEEVWHGVEEWVEDTDSIWRALRRNRYDESKTHASLLSALSQRIKMSLHAAVPSIPPYTESCLFHILPLPRYTDRLDRPIAVLSVREVSRDEEGNLDDMKEWTWWALEMLRRTLRDWWVKGQWDDRQSSSRRGRGGEGCVLVVDAAGAGYRNMEVELLPTLLSVGHNNFPGLIEAVYVVNAGWTHRSMWSIIKRVLPRSALEKVAFLDSPEALSEIFDIARLPKEYGGEDPYVFDPTHNPILQHFFRHSSNGGKSISVPPRNSSMASIADVYYTARNTPATSRRNSFSNDDSRGDSGSGRGGGLGLGLGALGSRLKMTKSREKDPSDETLLPPNVDVIEPTPNSDRSPFEEDFGRVGSTWTPDRSSADTSKSQTPLQRIKSLSDFHLYLSPSRLANIDMLSDSESEDDHSTHQPVPLVPPAARGTLRPALLEGQVKRSKSNSRPSLRLNGIPRHVTGDDAVRSYSGRLQLHHAKALEHYAGPSSLAIEAQTDPSDYAHSYEDTSSEYDQHEEEVVDSSIHVEPARASRDDRSIAAYSSSNPWFGYPVVSVPDPLRKGGTSLRPRYSRNRKRDLAKTLLFLFMLRLQSWRDALERVLGVNRLRSWGLGISTRQSVGAQTPKDPSEGLVSSNAGVGHGQIVQRWDRDWWWMIITFLLLRGTWSRLVLAPAEAVLENVGLGSLEGWKVVFGLA